MSDEVIGREDFLLQGLTKLEVPKEILFMMSTAESIYRKDGKLSPVVLSFQHPNKERAAEMVIMVEAVGIQSQGDKDIIEDKLIRYAESGAGSVGFSHEAWTLDTEGLDKQESERRTKLGDALAKAGLLHTHPNVKSCLICQVFRPDAEYMAMVRVVPSNKEVQTPWKLLKIGDESEGRFAKIFKKARARNPLN